MGTPDKVKAVSPVPPRVRGYVNWTVMVEITPSRPLAYTAWTSAKIKPNLPKLSNPHPHPFHTPSHPHFSNHETEQPATPQQLLGINGMTENENIDQLKEYDLSQHQESVGGPMRIRRIKRPIPAGTWLINNIIQIIKNFIKTSLKVRKFKKPMFTTCIPRPDVPCAPLEVYIGTTGGPRV